MLKRTGSVLLSLALILCFMGPTLHAQEEIQTIEIIANTPTLGARVNKNTLASNVQTAHGDQIENSGSLNLADFLQNNFTRYSLAE